MGDQTLLASLFQHKAWVNAGLLQAFAAHETGLPAAQRHAAIRILNHIYVVDRIFAAHLQGVDHGYGETNTQDTPSIGQLSASVGETDRWYLDYVAGIGPAALAEKIAFTFTDGSRGRMSRQEMLAHVVSHGSYHRGEVSQLVPSVSDAGPQDLLTAHLHHAEPGRRV
jgi:uncharacterized damage-inducible protein DinB